MERQFPKNVKQVGNVSDTPKIYVEDYVDTYLNQLKEQGEENLVVLFLIGEVCKIQGQECVFVRGAVRIHDLDTNLKELNVGKEHLEMGKQQAAELFLEQEIVGWLVIAPEEPLELSSEMKRVHEKLFPKSNSIFVLKGIEEEKYFAYKFRELMDMGGHYIYYEKNPDMQNYIISQRKKLGVTPSEVVEDRAAKDFRSTVRDRMEIKERKKESRYVYLTSVLLVVVVLAIGISTMNNYDKISSVQTSIETISKAIERGDNSDGADEKMDEEQEKSEMEPVVSTIQEDMKDAEYYVVKKGDTLDTISRKLYGSTLKVDEICNLNGLEDGNLIFIGQKLLLP